MEDQNLFNGVVRAKGCFWTSSEPDTRIDYSLVGRSGNLVVNQMWAQAAVDTVNSGKFKLRANDGTGKALPLEQQKAGLERIQERVQIRVARQREAGLWHPITHDRRVDLLFIGEEVLFDR